MLSRLFLLSTRCALGCVVAVHSVYTSKASVQETKAQLEAS